MVNYRHEVCYSVRWDQFAAGEWGGGVSLGGESQTEVLVHCCVWPDLWFSLHCQTLISQTSNDQAIFGGSSKILLYYISSAFLFGVCKTKGTNLIIFLLNI